MRKYNVKAFGVAREIMGGREIAVETDGATVRALREVIESRYPELKTLKSFFIAVNSEYASEETALQPGDEIAVIPPVSGG